MVEQIYHNYLLFTLNYSLKNNSLPVLQAIVFQSGFSNSVLV